MSLGGDVEKTAIALRCNLDEFKLLADDEGWQRKLKQWNSLSGSQPRDVSIQVNRAVNYVQAHRLRSIIDKVVEQMALDTPDELIARLTVNTRDGSRFESRILTDLVKAAETAQLMTQRALGDTADERPEESSGGKGSAIALDVMRALNAVDNSKMDSVSLVKRELAKPTVLPVA